MKTNPCLALLLMIMSSLIVTGQSTPKWYKGNTHTHTLNSDGDSTPDAVVKWYRDKGYNFLFITDHEFITPVGPLNDQFAKPGEFAVFSGQEVTDGVPGKPLHVNGLGLTSVCLPKKATTIVENLQKNIDCIRAVGGVPHVNHPNFGWALTAQDIAKLKNVMLLDIYNGHPLVNNLGGGGLPGTEAIWDEVLTTGRLIYGVAVDDSHYFKRLGDRSAPTPGQAWVMVRAEELSMTAILAAMERGDLYATTGIELADVQVSSREISIDIREERTSKYTVHFIGRGGRILKTTLTDPAVYQVRGDEGYVRAKIIESNGKMAWTQPLMTGRRPKV